MRYGHEQDKLDRDAADEVSPPPEANPGGDGTPEVGAPPESVVPEGESGGGGEDADLKAERTQAE